MPTNDTIELFFPCAKFKPDCFPSDQHPSSKDINGLRGVLLILEEHFSWEQILSSQQDVFGTVVGGTFAGYQGS